MDLVVKNARLADRPRRWAARHRNRRWQDRGDRAGAGRGARGLRCRRASGLRRADRDPHPSRQVAHRRPGAAAFGKARQSGDDDGAPEKGFHGRGRLRPRRGDAARMPGPWHDPHPHAARNRSGGRTQEFRCRRAAGGRLPLGRRSRNLRLPAGRDDQLSRDRGAAGRGVAARRAGARRRAALRQRPRRRRSTGCLRWPANTTSTSTCISTSATTRRRCTSIRCSN